MCRLKPEEVERCFMERARAVRKGYEREVAAIDGRRYGDISNRRKGESPPCGQCAGNGAPSGLRAGEDGRKSKANTAGIGTITAIPALPEKNATEGYVVTIHATGCRYGIASRVAQTKADYLFSLKGNRESPYTDTQEYFSEPGFSAPAEKQGHISFRPVSTHEEKHGRIEDRDYAASEDAAWLTERRPR